MWEILSERALMFKNLLQLFYHAILYNFECGKAKCYMHIIICEKRIDMQNDNKFLKINKQIEKKKMTVFRHDFHFQSQNCAQIS